MMPVVARTRIGLDAARRSLSCPVVLVPTMGALHHGHRVLLRRARHVVTEIDRVAATVEAVRAGDWRAVGAMFLASHVSMRDDFEISCPELDVAVSTAAEAGARMTGGGFGGSAIALVPEERLEAVANAIDVAFAAGGFGAPAHLRAEPSAAAGVIAT